MALTRKGFFVLGSFKQRVSASVECVCARCIFLCSGGVDLHPHRDSVVWRDCSRYPKDGEVCFWKCACCRITGRAFCSEQALRKSTLLNAMLNISRFCMFVIFYGPQQHMSEQAVLPLRQVQSISDGVQNNSACEQQESSKYEQESTKWQVNLSKSWWLCWRMKDSVRPPST